MPSIRLSLRFAAFALATGLLSGCASVFLVDNQVESFPRWQDRAANAAVPAPPQVYRFERLPSQEQQRSASGQDELERLAEAALAKHGWTRAAANVSAPWAVQVDASTLRLPRAPWDDPWMNGWGPWGWGHPFAMPGRDYVVTGSGQVLFFPMMGPRFESPYYQRAVSLLIRDARTARVVYETRAGHDGRWNSTPGLWSAMLDAALQGFPVPPPGVRQVNIEVPR